MTTKIRVGIVDYLNSRPLAWGFSSGALTDRYESVYDSPARIADRLAAAEIDIGLIPSIEYARMPGLRLLKAGCVAAEKDVRSVVLVSKVPFSDIESLALDDSSRTSAVLVRIVLDELYGSAPRAAPAAADLDSMLARHDAALIIGDPALRVNRSRWQVLDLASAWNRLTGLPFVFALWAVREGVGSDRLEDDFSSSLRSGLENLPVLAEDAGRKMNLAPASLLDYLENSLSFELGPRELAALQEFFRHAEGWLDSGAPPPLRFIGD